MDDRKGLVVLEAVGETAVMMEAAAVAAAAIVAATAAAMVVAAGSEKNEAVKITLIALKTS